MSEPENQPSKPHLNPGKKPMSKLHIAALCASLGLTTEQVPALKDLRLTDDVEFTPIPESIREKCEADRIVAADAKRARKAAKKTKPQAS